LRSPVPLPRMPTFIQPLRRVICWHAAISG
jgi:hypothetical protein